MPATGGGGGTGDTADAYAEETFECGGGQPDEYDHDDKRPSSVSCSSYEVKELDGGGRFSAKLRVASAFYPMIIGKKGASKKRIESETRTKINIPRQV